MVGVVGSPGDRAALDWAARRATAAHRPLRLVAVLDRHWPATADGEPSYAKGHNWRTLSELRARLQADFPDLMIDPEVRVGDPLTVLLDFADSASMIVLGHRTPGNTIRGVHGSTSLAIAGRCAVPTVLVPPDWNAVQHQGEAVVVGRHPTLPNTAAMSFAFAEANWRQVDLIMVDVVRRSGGDSALSLRSRCACQQSAVRHELTWLRSSYPDVLCDITHARGRPELELLGQARSAQLLVVGRHHTGLRGFEVGSTARSVAYDARLPVAVIPQPADDRAETRCTGGSRRRA